MAYSNFRSLRKYEFARDTYIDPSASADVQRIAKVTFTDLDRSWALHVRRGVAEVSEVIPDNVDVTILLPRLAWANIVIGQTNLAERVEAGEAQVDGDQAALAEILAPFGRVSTARPDPDDVHR